MPRNEVIASIIGLVFISIPILLAQSVSISEGQDDRYDLIREGTIKQLQLPDRLENAMSGTEFIRQVAGLSRSDREIAIVREIMSGNVPSFSRTLRPLNLTEVVDGKIYALTFFALQDYIAIGSDKDYLYIPMTPLCAQYLANRMDCSLPTKKIVDTIYQQAGIQLSPQPIPPSDSMTSVPVFKQHTDSIMQQMTQRGIDRSTHKIIAGHKKDIIVSNSIYRTDKPAGCVAIYGWHRGRNKPIQPVYNGHHALYADYSHGTRLLSNLALLNGDTIRIDTLLKDPNLSILLSNEGIISPANYPESDLFPKDKK